MDVRRQSLLSDRTVLAEVTAALDWWREAGVDCAFDDAPQPWLVPADRAPPPAAPAATAPSAPPPRITIGGDTAHWPTEISAFAPWWLREPALDSGQVRGRVPPRGAVDAPLMILVSEPEAQDSDTLLSGPQGRLLAAMLAAMGLSEPQAYIASALPRRTPMADWRDLAAQGLGEVLRLHLALARPRRLIVFGRHLLPLLMPPGLESPLPDHAPTQILPLLPTISHDGGSMSVLIARDLGSLLERPIAKGHFWQHWLEWSGS